MSEQSIRNARLVFGASVEVGYSIFAVAYNYGLQVSVPEGHEVKIEPDLVKAGVKFNSKTSKIVFPKKGAYLAFIIIDRAFPEVKVRVPSFELLPVMTMGVKTDVDHEVETAKVMAEVKTLIGMMQEDDELLQVLNFLGSDVLKTKFLSFYKLLSEGLETFNWQKVGEELLRISKGYENLTNLLPKSDQPEADEEVPVAAQ